MGDGDFAEARQFLRRRFIAEPWLLGTYVANITALLDSQAHECEDKERLAAEIMRLVFGREDTVEMWVLRQLDHDGIERASAVFTGAEE